MQTNMHILSLRNEMKSIFPKTILLTAATDNTAVTFSDGISKRSWFIQSKRTFNEIRVNHARPVVVPVFKQLVDLVAAFRQLCLFFQLQNNSDVTFFIPSGLRLACQAGYKMCRCYFLFNGPLGNRLSQNVLDRSSLNFQDKYTFGTK